MALALALPIPADPSDPVFAIVYELNRPRDEEGGIASLLPPDHPHADQDSGWYYMKLTTRLQELGYQRGEYCVLSKHCTIDEAMNDACHLHTHPSLTWMSVPGVVRYLHVVQHTHMGSLC